jgi:hypothetical protein
VPLRSFLQAFWQQDEALDPIDVGFFSADGMMFGSDGVSDTVKQFLLAALCLDRLQLVSALLL